MEKENKDKELKQIIKRLDKLIALLELLLLQDKSIGADDLP